MIDFSDVRDIDPDDEPRTIPVPSECIRRARERMFRIFLYSSPEWIDRQFELMRKGAERDALREYPREHQRALRLMRTAQIIDESVGHDPVAARKEMTAPAWTMRTIVTYIAHLFTRKEQAVSMPKAVVRPPAPSGEHRRTDPA